MQISNETIQVLKNFAAINSNLMIRKGKTLSTISTAKNIFGKAEVAEEFPQEVAIYDLNSLLALLTLMENQNVEFGEKSLTISKDNGKFEYFYSAPNVIVAAPEKCIELDNHYQFTLTAEDVNMIMGFDKGYTTDLRFMSNPIYTFNKKIISHYEDIVIENFANLN
jgi:hypothetical protein